MWPDNETECDFLNFTGVADTVAEITVQAQGRPSSIGVSGARTIISEWRELYNNVRPRSSLNYQLPAMFVRRLRNSEFPSE